MTWPAQSPDLNIIETRGELKLQSEAEVIKTRALLIDAVCRIWKSLSVRYIQSLYATISRRLHTVNVGKRFRTKC